MAGDMGASAPSGSGFRGTCDEPSLWDSIKGVFTGDLGRGCSGVFLDAGQGYQDVQQAMRAASSIGDAQQVQAELDKMSEALGEAGSHADASLREQAASSIEAAFAAITDTRTYIDQGQPFKQAFADAAAKTTVALNQLTAGKVTLTFAKEQLRHDLKPVNPFDWDWEWTLLGIGIGAVAALVIYRRFA